MPNIALVLRDEIRRLARKEIREHVGPLRESNRDLKRQVTSLKRDVGDLERRLRYLDKQEKRRLETAPKAKEADGLRFSPKWVRSDRQRLGLSAKNYAQLVGVSMLTVYNWEKGKSKPRAKQLASLAKLRGVGKREATRRLELLAK